jgi:hypothetical protein
MNPGQFDRLRSRPAKSRRELSPMARSYDSHRPNVRIHRNAQHVAEKYLQLARDAPTGGDPVAMESYLQHAEHYFRLIAAAKAVRVQSQNGYIQASKESNPPDLDDEDDFGGLPDRFTSLVGRETRPFIPQADLAPLAIPYLAAQRLPVRPLEV